MQKIQGYLLLEVCIASCLLICILVFSGKAWQGLMQNLSDLQQRQFALRSLKQAHEILQVCMQQPSFQKQSIPKQSVPKQLNPKQSVQLRLGLQSIATEVQTRLNQGKLKLIANAEQTATALAIIWQPTHNGSCIHEVGKACITMSVPNAAQCLDLL